MPKPTRGGRPFEVTGRQIVARSGRFALRYDTARWPDGLEGGYSYLEAPSAAVIVPVREDGTTVLVSQWRHPWDEVSWELPAGTLEDGEDPLAGAQRELAEEAGLHAQTWEPLGTARGSAAVAMRFHLFLARDLSDVPRSPEAYEQDMTLRSADLRAAIDEVVHGKIQHAATAVALLRAARALRIL